MEHPMSRAPDRAADQGPESHMPNTHSRPILGGGGHAFAYLSALLLTLILSANVYLDWTFHRPSCVLPPPDLARDCAVSNRSGAGEVRHSESVRSRRTGALKGLGTTFRKGSRAMSELVVAHLDDGTSPAELRLFLRALHRSGVTARADVVLLLPDGPPSTALAAVVHAEERSFWTLMLLHGKDSGTVPQQLRKKRKHKGRKRPSTSSLDRRPSQIAGNSTTGSSPESSDNNAAQNVSRRIKEAEAAPTEAVPTSPFRVAAFRDAKSEGAQKAGKRRRPGRVIWESQDQATVNTVDWADWGSIVGFEMRDLEIESALASYIDDPPAHLRRWVCYELLLGMLKPYYRNVLLTEVRGVLVLGDVMLPTRDTSFGTRVHLFHEDRTWSQARRLEEIASAANASQMVVGDAEKELSVEPGVELAREPVLLDNSSESTGRQEMAFIHDVYGRKIWRSLREEDKKQSVLSCGVILGNLKSVRALSTSMLTEIVHVAALIRNSRQKFHDQPLFNYLVMRSGILSKKISDKLVFSSNGASLVHALPASKQKSVFTREDDVMFHLLQGLSHRLVRRSTAQAILESVRVDICSPVESSKAYDDCSSQSGRESPQ